MRQHKKWTNYLEKLGSWKRNTHLTWQLEKLNKLLDSGVSYEVMSEIFGKSVKAIRGKVYWIYGTETLNKVREKRKVVG